MINERLLNYKEQIRVPELCCQPLWYITGVPVEEMSID